MREHTSACQSRDRNRRNTQRLFVLDRPSPFPSLAASKIRLREAGSSRAISVRRYSDSLVREQIDNIQGPSARRRAMIPAWCPQYCATRDARYMDEGLQGPTRKERAGMCTSPPHSCRLRARGRRPAARPPNVRFSRTRILDSAKADAPPAFLSKFTDRRCFRIGWTHRKRGFYTTAFSAPETLSDRRQRSCSKKNAVMPAGGLL